MFTGIILGLGELSEKTLHGQDAHFTFTPAVPLHDIVDGESIAVNGCCLSVENHTGSQFSVYASQETLSKTTLSHLALHAPVNLERALAVGDRLGGHIVSGHVDCVATVTDEKKAAHSRIYRITYPKEHTPCVLAKGSVALDGISLTVNACGSGFLEVNVIPDTQKRTNVCTWRKGTKVNMETDLLGKYVQKMLQEGVVSLKTQQTGQHPLSKEFLMNAGFI